ncbi:pyridoxamine 5-phosphate oxidase [Pseudonocardia sp. MCCB 268]|nr:pyridoxamine 5-phosphate oxidase [Pseudonocardia cytotoxica]
MVEFIGRMEMAFIATADGHGECDSSRAGPPGFVRLTGRAHAGLPRVPRQTAFTPASATSSRTRTSACSWWTSPEPLDRAARQRPGLIMDDDAPCRLPRSRPGPGPGGARSYWVVVEVEEVTSTAASNIPRMERVTQRKRAWGTDDLARKGGDSFGRRGRRSGRRRPGARFPSTTHLGRASRYRCAAARPAQRRRRVRTSPRRR